MEGGGGFFNKAGSPEGSATRRAREYHECSFCKRGFTNAQALGGHMNIHRKERGGAGGGSRSSLRGGGGAAPPAGAQRDAGGAGAGGSRPHGGDQVHLGLTLGRSEEVDLELRLWH
uniref:Uncharacterized protein n=1 Tax=Avena sativa TaxID=4498 RepID=A0ACD5UBJ7_AVESA